MSATIKLPAPLRRLADQVKIVETSAQDVGGALRGLVKTYPDMSASIYDDAGEIKSYVRVFVGGRDINDLDGPATTLDDGDVVSIVPPVAGA